MLNIGNHISVSQGFDKAAEEIIKINGNTFQFFTRNPRGGKARDWSQKEVEKLNNIRKEKNFAPLLAHGAYTINLASDKSHVREFGIELLRDDVKRIDYLGDCNLVFHPGSHVGQGVEKGSQLIIDGLNEILNKDLEGYVLLETMSGKGTEIGRSFEEINYIIENVENNKKLGVCLDTCHIFAAGYDIVNDLDNVVEEFDKVIGLNRLKAIHLNDSLMELGSNKDRHGRIGEGLIGKEALIRVINHEKLKNIPFYLETPNDDILGYGEEIDLLKSNYIED